MRIPVYPNDFFHYQSKEENKTTDETVNNWIKECINELEKNEESDSYSIACEDTIVQVNRCYEDENTYYYIVDVSKNYHETEVHFEGNKS